MARGQTIRKPAGGAEPSRIRIGRARIRSDAAAHTPGVHKGEETALRRPETGLTAGTRTARDATSLNPGQRDPIDPRMPFMPPA